MSALLGVGLAAVAAAQTGEWQARRIQSTGPAPYEQFDLVADVDGETLIEIKDNTVSYRALSGQPPANAGTKTTMPLPQRDAGRFEVQQLSGREPIQVVQRPSRTNDWATLVHIDDQKAGSDEYHLRIRWDDPDSSKDDIAAPQPIDWPGFSASAPLGEAGRQTTVHGFGSISIDRGPAVPVSSAWIDLADDHRFSIELQGPSGNYTLQGSWKDAGDRGVELNIDTAAGESADASGIIRLNNGVDRIELGSSRYDDVVGTFRVTETDAPRVEDPVTPQPDDGEPITETVQGSGRVVSNAITKNIDAMEVYLLDNGRVQLQVFGSGLKESFGGRWTRDESDSGAQERYDIELNTAFGAQRANAGGTVVLDVTGQTKKVQLVTLEGSAGREHGDFRLTFRQR